MNEFVEKEQFKMVLSQARPVLFKSLEGGVVESKRPVGYPSDNIMIFIDGEFAIGGWVEVDIDLADIDMGDE